MQWFLRQYNQDAGIHRYLADAVIQIQGIQNKIFKEPVNESTVIYVDLWNYLWCSIALSIDFKSKEYDSVSRSLSFSQFAGSSEKETSMASQ